MNSSSSTIPYHEEPTHDSGRTCSLITCLLPYNRRIYIGGEYWTQGALKRLGIEYVIDVSHPFDDVSPYPWMSKFAVSDRPDWPISNILDTTSALIEKESRNNRAILVHCQMGISRSVTLVIDFMMQYLGYTRYKALLDIRRDRTCACPNSGFMRQIKKRESDEHTLYNTFLIACYNDECLWTEAVSLM